MQLLLAYADAELRQMLKHVLASLLDEDLEIVESGDGVETMELLTKPDCPAVALIDWDLPGCSGPEICRRARAARRPGPPYIILLALREHALAEGFAAGADDCVRIPVPGDELLGRIGVGRRYAELPWQRLDAVAAGSLWVTRPRTVVAATPASAEAVVPRDAVARRVHPAPAAAPSRSKPVSRAAAELVAYRTADDDDGLDAGRIPGRSTIQLQSVIVAG